MKLSDSRLVNRRQWSRIIRKTGSLSWILVRIMRTSWDKRKVNLGRSWTRFWDVERFCDISAAGVPAISKNEEHDKEDDGQSSNDNSDCES